MPELSIRSILKSSSNDIYVGYLNLDDLSDLPDHPRIKLIDLNEMPDKTLFTASGESYLDFTAPDFYRLVQYKWVLLQHVASLDFEYIIFSDFDVYWNQDPVLDIAKVFEKYTEIDFQIQTYTSDPSFQELCMGFVAIRNCSRTLLDLDTLKHLHADMLLANPKTGDDDVISSHYKNELNFRSRVLTLPQSTFPTGNLINNFKKMNSFPGLVPYRPYIFHANFVIGSAKKIRLLETFIYNSQFGNTRFSLIRRVELLIYLLIRRVGHSINRLFK
jgi:hypothetical protein